MVPNYTPNQAYCLIVTGMSWVTGFVFWWTGVSGVIGFALVGVGVFFAVMGLGTTDDNNKSGKS